MANMNKLNLKNLFSKNLPNFLSILRIILSLSLFLTIPLSLNFYIIYLLAGFTDILDGYLAKNIFNPSELGAKLDSFADLIFFLSFLIILYPVLNINYFILIWILTIVFIKILSIIIGFIKFNQFTFIHTYLNKLIGGLLILIPLWLLFIPSNVILDILCLIASFSAIEELLIIIFSKNLDLNLKTIFSL